jgi:PKD repeat protein
MQCRGEASVYTVNTVAADSITGSHTAPNAIVVGAADAATPNVLYYYCSQGPATLRWPAPATRRKPDITGVDGCLITGAGGFGYWDGAHHLFYGTSAAAPHIAALVALAWSGKPSATNAQVRTALLESAEDRGAAGYDYGWGYGWPDATAFATRLGIGTGIRAVPPGTLMPQDTDADGWYDDVNGNGRPDFADVVLYFNQMTWISANEPIEYFDYNGNGRIDFADVVWLFNHL